MMMFKVILVIYITMTTLMMIPIPQPGGLRRQSHDDPTAIMLQSHDNHAAIKQQSHDNHAVIKQRLTLNNRAEDAQPAPALELLEQSQRVLVRQLERVAVHLAQ